MSRSAQPADEPPAAWLATHKPLALLTRFSDPAVLFMAGAAAGALGKTLTAPLDRLKLIMQVRGRMVQGALRDAAMKGSVGKAFIEIGRQGGVASYWKGNLPQVLRVIPYSAAQLCGYELLKRCLADEQGKLSVDRKLLAGAGAGMMSTLMTYPLDTLRMRLALDPSLRSIPKAVVALLREGGPTAFYRGLGPALIGIAPYMALELATYDSLPEELPAFARGFGAALLATSCCYPLDTIRRQIQIRSNHHVTMLASVRSVYGAEGAMGFYRGFLPNALKNLPNKGIRLSVFSYAKEVMAGAKTAKAEADTEWRERRRPRQCKEAARQRKADGQIADAATASGARPVTSRAVTPRPEPLLAASTSWRHRV